MIYNICERIAREDDQDAMLFAVKEKYVYVKENTFSHHNILMKAAFENKLYLIRLLIKSNIDVNIRNNYNCTALIEASKKGHYEAVKLLLSHPEIDLNAKDIIKKSALVWASENQHHDVAKLLKDHGA